MSLNSIAIVAFIIWSFPLTYFRSRFRKMVYKTNNWTINIKPVFWKKLKFCLDIMIEKITPTFAS